ALGEHAVPSRLAQPLVDVPQPVDIDDHDREAQGVAARPLELVPQPAIERVEAGAPGQDVGHPGADLPPVDRGAPLLVLQHPRGCSRTSWMITGRSVRMASWISG